MTAMATPQEALDEQVDPFLGAPEDTEPKPEVRFRQPLAAVVCLSLLASAAGLFVREAARPGTASAGDGIELASTPKEKLGTSLFCFMAVLPDSYEVLLLDEMQERGMSIFACDARKWVWGKKTGVFVAPGDGLVVAEYAANSALFVTIWKQIFDEGVYLDHDWTVKVDPDTVWSPDRLRQHLEALHVTAGEAVYIRNVEWKLEIHGAIEVLSAQAASSLAGAVCEPVRADNDTWGGEDDWLHKCVAQLGMKPRSDLKMLLTWAHLDGCNDTSFVAFHPYKNISDWRACADLMDSA